MNHAEEYAAHINSETGEIQSVMQHCCNVAALSENFVCQPMKDLAYDIGLLHDVGKYQDSFQRRIREGAKIRVDHSTCGAKAAASLPMPASLMAAYCIAGHHSGIPDGGTAASTEDDPTLRGRVKRKFEDFSEYQTELMPRKIDGMKLAQYVGEDCEKDTGKIIDKFAFITRYLYSALVDADSLDTEQFCTGTRRETLTSDFQECEKKAFERLGSFTAVTDLQKARGRIQQQAFREIENPAEIYLMNMPTGSGKTLCSIACALKKARIEGKKRIIYVIPYNSIISQTAETFQKLFGKSASILRHQSTFAIEEQKPDARAKDAGQSEEDYRTLLRQATENWDAELIITTTVQFFESIYSNKRSRVRKLHNMADSVLIFDEIHMMPRENMRPCLEAIAYLTKYMNSTALFLTATMPDFEQLIRAYAPGDIQIHNLIPNHSDFRYFQRCAYEYAGTVSEERLIESVSEHASSLVILNSRKETRRLYSMTAEGKVFHLSTYMTAFDRQRTINEIHNALEEQERRYSGHEDSVPLQERIIVYSTSLIEAGVDLDFQTVYREIAGVDNILQSGGRCNREGKRDGAKTIIFELESERTKPSSDDRAEITRGLLKQFDSIDDESCIREYYRQLFDLHKDEMEKNAICRSQPGVDLLSIPFASYSFEMISNEEYSIAVGEDDESRKLIEEIRETGGTLSLSREIQRYCCSVKRWELDELIQQRAIDDYGTGIWCLTDPNHYYDLKTGVRFETSDTFIEGGGC